MPDIDRSLETPKQRIAVPWSVLLTASLVGLVALAVGTGEGYLSAVVVGSILVLAGIFRIPFRASRAFCLTLSNLVGIYACIFLFFVESDFFNASAAALSIAFMLPLLAFVAGSFWHRDTIMRVAVSGHIRDQRHFLRILGWLIPVFAIGGLSSLLPDAFLSGNQNSILLVAMTSIALIVLFVSRDVAIFLLDTGLLFEAFFSRMTGLVVPAFAFLTCYSLLVILFASVYTVLDHFAGGTNFRVDGALRAISFPESLFFSLTTLSTVGYGDITPISSAVRVVAAGEIVCGILLLLFGFNEIFSFAGSHGNRDQRD